MTDISRAADDQLFAEGLAHHQAGRLPQAEMVYRRILSSNPRHAGAWHLLGVLAAQVGKLEPALECFRNAIALLPGNAVYSSNFGETYRKLKRYAEAEAAFRRAIELDPQFADACSNYGIMLLELQRDADARDLLAQATARIPHHPACWRLLGDAAVRLHRHDEALAAFETALRLHPAFAEARFNYASLLADLGRPADALAQLQQVLPAMPDDPQVRLLLAHTLAQSGQLQEAVNAYQRAIAVDPKNAEAFGGLANTLRAGDNLDESITAYGQAIALDPDDASFRGNLAFALRDQARLGEAVGVLRAALEKHPDHAAVRSALIFTMHLDPDIPPEQIAAEKQRWNHFHVDPLAASRVGLDSDPSPGRRLRIGYVSADFRRHPVGQFMQPLLAGHEREQFEVFGYSATANPDAVTASLRTARNHWRHIAGVSDEHAAGLVRADRIDILIDLCNHTTANRLLLFARKPAPVQITYLAYGAGTGLSTMDWRLTDPFIDPPALETAAALALLGERPLRMAETFWCYAPHPDAAEVSALPALSGGRFTFGSLNYFSKLNERVLALWAELLRALPETRLLVHVPSGSRQAFVRAFFTGRGIAAARLEIVPRMSPAEYFARYRQIDVALDPFPWAGGTTSCDALWMGVPVLSLAGSHAADTLSRGGASLLSNLGLSDWITHSAEEYLARARLATENLSALAAVRAGLRERMKKSVLMDAGRFARHVEDAYRRAWREWCGRANPAG